MTRIWVNFFFHFFNTTLVGSASYPLTLTKPVQEYTSIRGRANYSGIAKDVAEVISKVRRSVKFLMDMELIDVEIRMDKSGWMNPNQHRFFLTLVKNLTYSCTKMFEKGNSVIVYYLKFNYAKFLEMKVKIHQKIRRFDNRKCHTLLCDDTINTINNGIPYIKFGTVTSITNNLSESNEHPITMQYMKEN
ncbi:hypothetical protein LOAG_01236 [Loa loa]|uniref:Uncharacterized protein n=1 Tax=Loa loa TaxID=7209 RepID=A0A1S0UBJ6_LOALO|nr:hypothetical protein LOAG_01236 [Loa loa]EFO27254.1 hypothetical protein LOAG_01236 [Loa loa]